MPPRVRCASSGPPGSVLHRGGKDSRFGFVSAVEYGFIDPVRPVLFGWAPASCGAAVMFWVPGAAGRPGGGPRRLVPLLAAARMFTTHHRPHNSPHKSAPPGPFRRWPAQADPGCGRRAAGSGLWPVLVTVWAAAAAHHAAPRQAGQMAGVARPAYCWARSVPRGAGQPRRTGGGDAGRWRSLS